MRPSRNFKWGCARRTFSTGVIFWMINSFLIRARTSQGIRVRLTNSFTHSLNHSLPPRVLLYYTGRCTWIGDFFSNLNTKCVVLQHRYFQHKLLVSLSTKTCDIYNLKAWFISLLYRHITKAYWRKASSRKSSLLQWMQENTSAAMALWLLSTGRVANWGVQPRH